MVLYIYIIRYAHTFDFYIHHWKNSMLVATYLKSRHNNNNNNNNNNTSFIFHFNKLSSFHMHTIVEQHKVSK